MSQRFNPYRQFVGSFIPNCLMSYPGLLPVEKLMWARLAQYAGKDGGCFPSQKRLSEDLGISERYARKVLDGLERKGFIERSTQSNEEKIKGKTNKYFFLLHPIFQPGHESSGSAEPPTGTTVPLDRNHSSSSTGTTVPLARGTTVPPEENQGEEKKEKGSFDNLFEENKLRAAEILSKLCGSNEERKEAMKVKKGRKGKKRGPEGILNRSEG